MELSVDLDNIHLVVLQGFDPSLDWLRKALQVARRGANHGGEVLLQGNMSSKWRGKEEGRGGRGEGGRREGRERRGEGAKKGRVRCMMEGRARSEEEAMKKEKGRRGERWRVVEKRRGKERGDEQEREQRRGYT